jgi:peptide/nickel transport system permease protein
MALLTPASATIDPAAKQPHMLRWRRQVQRHRLAAVGLVVVLVIGGAGLLATALAPYDPQGMALEERHQRPGPEHLFGTDFFGRDVLSRLLYGARISLAVGFCTIALQALIGVPVGLVAGFYGRKVDSLLMRLTDVFMAFPPLLLALAIMALAGPGFWQILLALSIRGWAGFARLVRAEVLGIRSRGFVEAARALGQREWRILLHQVAPNTVSSILVYATLGIATPILTEAALSFLGLGIQPPAISWGLMINTDRHHLQEAWWAITFPGVAIMLTVFGFNVLGDGIRDVLDPKLRD